MPRFLPFHERDTRARPTDTPSVAFAFRQLIRALDFACGPYIGLLRRAWDRFGIAALALLLLKVYATAYHRLPARPKALVPGEGWWAWYDQGKTLEALLAIRSGHWGADHQWYPPLYALLGVAASLVMKAQPFFLPDGAGLVVFFVAFVAIAGEMRVSRLLAAGVFVAVCVWERTVLDAWIEPWNTSISAPLIALAILGAIKFSRSPARNGRWLALTGAAFGLMLGLRPSDILTLLPTIPFVLWHALYGSWDHRPDGAHMRRNVVAAGLHALAGFVPGALLVGGLHVAIWGFHPSGYMVMSAAIGFDWRLIPLHWVTLVADPRPLFSVGEGMVEAYWWLVPGMAGMWATLLLAARPGSRHIRRAADVMVISAIVLHWCQYLAYRDLHPTGLWIYHNYHYFVWTLPFIALYAARYAMLAGCVIMEAARAGWRGARPRLAVFAVAGLLSVLSVCWRAQIGPMSPQPAALVVQGNARQMLLPEGLSNMRDILLLPASGGQSKVYFGAHEIAVDGHVYHHFNDFRAFPVSGGAMVMPLRPMPAHRSILTMSDTTSIDPTIDARIVRFDTVFGVPCWAPRRIRPAICREDAPLPGPLMPPDGRQVDFNGRMEVPYLVPGGWSDHADGRWTMGYKSELQLRLDHLPKPGEGVVLEVEAAGFIPRGAGPVVADVSVNGTKVATWHISSTDPVALRAPVPGRLIGAGGNIHLEISATNARRPRDYTSSSDARLLGLRVRALRVLPWGARDQ